MKALNFLSTAKTVENGEVMVNPTFAEEVKSYLHPTSKSVDITIQCKDDMLGIKYSIYNLGNYPNDGVMGIDTEGLDAILSAMCGNDEALKAYDPTNRPVEKGANLKHEILEQFLNSPLKGKARMVTPQTGGNLIQVWFKLSYERTVWFYFPDKDIKAITLLEEANLLAAS